MNRHEVKEAAAKINKAKGLENLATQFEFFIESPQYMSIALFDPGKLRDILVVIEESIRPVIAYELRKEVAKVDKELESLGVEK